MVHGVVGYACSPTMQTPSPTQKPLAGMHASAAAAERVFSAQPIVQETESARGTDEKDEVYGGLLLKVTPPKNSVRSPGLLDNATVGGAEQWIKGADSERARCCRPTRRPMSRTRSWRASRARSWAARAKGPKPLI